MSIERRHVDGSHGSRDTPTNSGSADAKRSRTTLFDDLRGSEGDENRDAHGISHPAVIALARILGRSAARAEMRRTRCGAVPIMRSLDALLLATVVAAAVLIWGGVLVLL